MFRLKPLSVAVHRALSTVAIAATAVAPAVAQAQDETLEEVTVTGSRIAGDPNLVTSSPVTLLKAEDIAFKGAARVEDLLNDLPSVTPEFTANESNGATGAATIDLRGLTSDRTLVLTNGHRMGFGDKYQLAPDINTVPGTLVERIEVLTGGASATYGSDAMAGVVNFIMKSDFEGIQFDYQYSAYQHSSGNPSDIQTSIAARGFDQAPDSVWDGGGHDINVTIGVNTGDGRGNITGYFGYRQTNPITQGERDLSACALSSAGASTCSGSATLPTGLFTPFDGNFYFTVAGDQFVPWDYTYYNYAPPNHFQRPDERWTAGLFGHYEVNEHLEGYVEFQFMDDRSNAQIAPSGAFFVTSTLNCNNPLMSAQQSALLCDGDRTASIANTAADPTAVADFITAQVAGVQDTTLTVAAQAAADAAATAAANATIANSLLVNSCNNGNLLDGTGAVVANTACPLYIGRRNVEGGFRNDDLGHTSYRILGGVRGDINDDWSYDAYANFSRTLINEQYNNDLSITRIIRALDVVDVAGTPTCQSVVDGSDSACVPWDLFTAGNVTQDALDYIYINMFTKGRLEQDQFVAYVAGDLTSMGVVSPMAEDGAQIVFGAEYRDEKMTDDPDDGFNSGDGAGQGGATPDVFGENHVFEIFVEAKIPIAQNQQWIESLTADLGYRFSDYAGPVQTDTYKALGEWTPVQGFKLRGGYTRAVRAANLRERFLPESLGLWSGTDPCAGATPVLTAAQCALTGVSAAQYGNVPLSPAGQYNGHFGGNTALEPEKSNSFTIGAVITPEDFIPGLTLSVDYWSIEIKDAISTIGPETAITNCGLTGDAAFCSLINRGATNGNVWIGSSFTSPHVVATNINIGGFDVAGIDFFASYNWEPGNYGIVDFTFRGTYLDKFDQQPLPGAAIEKCAGVYGGNCQRPRPEWKHSLSAVWSTPWNLTFAGSWRYIKGVDEFGADRFSAGAENYLDLTAEYVPTFLGFGETTLRMGVNNVTDNNPPVSGLFGNVSVFGNGNTIPGLWDSLGRYFHFSISQKF
jgi:iron complex outermembrane recepter protein